MHSPYTLLRFHYAHPDIAFITCTPKQFHNEIDMALTKCTPALSHINMHSQLLNSRWHTEQCTRSCRINNMHSCASTRRYAHPDIAFNMHSCAQIYAHPDIAFTICTPGLSHGDMHTQISHFTPWYAFPDIEFTMTHRDMLAFTICLCVHNMRSCACTQRYAYPDIAFTIYTPVLSHRDMHTQIVHSQYALLGFPKEICTPRCTQGYPDFAFTIRTPALHGYALPDIAFTICTPGLSHRDMHTHSQYALLPFHTKICIPRYWIHDDTQRYAQILHLPYSCMFTQKYGHRLIITFTIGTPALSHRIMHTQISCFK